VTRQAEMANRYIKDSIWTSVNFNKLSVEAERHFVRILVAVDDWGCLEITPLVIKGRCYPLKTDITEAEIETWNKEMIECEILREWVDNGREYAMFLKFDDHNEALEKHDPKTPCPPWLLMHDRIDPRSSEKTAEAFQRIAEAYNRLSNNGHHPRWDEIATAAKSSKSTVVKFFKKNKHLKRGTAGTDAGTDA